MKISIGSDHGGFSLKEEIIKELQKQNVEVVDKGTYDTTSVDYPVYAEKVCRDIQKKVSDFGVLICTTGIGMCISANKFKGIRAALVSNKDSAIMTRRHNNSNVICLGARYTSLNDAVDWIMTFVNEKFEGGRHLRRVELIGKQEEEK